MTKRIYLFDLLIWLLKTNGPSRVRDFHTIEIEAGQAVFHRYPTALMMADVLDDMFCFEKHYLDARS